MFFIPVSGRERETREKMIIYQFTGDLRAVKSVQPFKEA